MSALFLHVSDLNDLLIVICIHENNWRFDQIIRQSEMTLKPRRNNNVKLLGW